MEIINLYCLFRQLPIVCKREIESVMEKSKMSVRVVEKSGRTVRSVLQRSSLEEGGGCDKEDECVESQFN